MKREKQNNGVFWIASCLLHKKQFSILFSYLNNKNNSNSKIKLSSIQSKEHAHVMDETL